MAILHFFSLGIALRASSPGRSGSGEEKEGEFASTSLSGIWIPLWLPVEWAVRFLPISAKRKRARMKTNIEKHVPRVMTSLLMSFPSNQLCASNFSMQIFKIRWRSCKLSLSFPATPPERHGKLARRLVLEDQSLRLDGLWRLGEWSII